MKLYVTKLRRHYPLLFVLIIAFISMQGASAHVHLAENHNHDGIHHHEAESHAHNLTTHYSDTVDSSHLADASNTVDLDNQCNVPSGKSQSPDLIAIEYCSQQYTYVQTVRIEPPFTNNLFYHLFDRSTANPRAPPYFS